MHASRVHGYLMSSMMYQHAAGSSVLHMQVVVLCIAVSQHSLLVLGAMLQLGAHSWIASMLFMYIGEVYETQGSRSSRVHSYAGRSSTAMLLLLLANSGYPTTPSYTAEFLAAGYSGVSGMLSITFLLAALGGWLAVVGSLQWIHGAQGRSRIHVGIHVASQGPTQCTQSVVLGMVLGMIPSSMAWSVLHSH